MSHILEVSGLSVSFGVHQVFQNLFITVGAGEIVVVRGSSGCGKTTLLRCIAGLHGYQKGRIMLKGRDISQVDPYIRGVSLIAQNAADVFPWFAARTTIAFGLQKCRDHPGTGNDHEIVEALAAKVHLPEAVLDQKGRTLSGGQRQRVSLARVLAERPVLVLADEPLSNLDEKLSEQLAGEMRQFFHEHGMAVLYVTHDSQEAERIADRVVQFRSLCE